MDIEYVFKKLKNHISPLRLQGILDHSYGEYNYRKSFEKILLNSFTKIMKVDGIP